MTDAEEMADLLNYANLAKVGDALGVSRNAVSRWSRGQDVNPHRLRQVRDLLRPSQPTSSHETLMRRVLAGVMALEIRDGVGESELATATVAAEAFERLAAEADRRLAQRLAASQQGPGARDAQAARERSVVSRGSRSGSRPGGDSG